MAEASATLAFGLAERGYEVAVATGYLPSRADLQPHARLRIARFDVEYHTYGEGRSRQEGERMQRWILDEDPDVIICQRMEDWATVFAERVFSRLRGKKVIVSHGYATYRWQPNPLFPFGLRCWIGNLIRKVIPLPWAFRRYDRAVFLSRKRDLDRFFDHKIRN